jgi:ankyrin repeat protein
MSSSDSETMAEGMARAAAAHDFDGIRALIREGASPNMPIPGFGTILIYAVCQGQQELAEYLVWAGARVDLADAQGDTPLHHAAQLGLQHIVESLLERNADPLLRNKSNETPYDVSRSAACTLEDQFDASAMSDDDRENAFSRFGRIATLLKDAGAEAHKQQAIAACHDGIREDMIVRAPLKFKMR